MNCKTLERLKNYLKCALSKNAAFGPAADSRGRAPRSGVRYRVAGKRTQTRCAERLAGDSGKPIKQKHACGARRHAFVGNAAQSSGVFDQAFLVRRAMLVVLGDLLDLIGDLRIESVARDAPITFCPLPQLEHLLHGQSPELHSTY